jgi:TorA maturation chaperone TorD
MDALDSRSEAIARSRTYHLLGSLFLRGITPGTMAAVKMVDPLAEHMNVFCRGSDAPDFDEAAADHQHVFGFNVFPFEGVFLDESAQVGGVTTRTVLDAYQAAGFPVARKAESADHVGVELNFLGFLCRREADATESDSRTIRRQMARFVDEHLGRWLPALTVALRNQQHPFFEALGELTLEVVTNHRAGLDVPAESFALPVPPDLLDDPKTGLRDIARYLLVPAYSGIYLARDDIRAYSGQGRLPAGFGARRTMMNNLLRSAADYDGFQDVFKALLEHHSATREYYECLSRRSTWWQAMTGPWLDRLRQTEDVLGQIRSAAAGIDDARLEATRSDA